ncbi:solute carrier family 23 member 1-like [Dreissena polymorpha]|uniref:solute carrier family 23 member 1-like n=1 Tax=Dreissena polymorpha TaxID=45954 RepID=UPI00226569AF|nr:solute carrier family 23 member 1-like [Dreissena polymorpha]
MNSTSESKATVDGEVAKTDKAMEVTSEPESPIMYKISDSPPLYLTIFFAVQQSLIPIAASIILPLLVAEAACALEDGDFIRKLVSSTLFLSGLTTLLQVLVGVRLPVYQGPSGSYAVPIIALNKMDPSRCDVYSFHGLNSSSELNVSKVELQANLVDIRVREMMGPLILAGFLHFLIGATGLVGLLLRFIGPVTIVPTILLIGLYIVKPAMTYTGAHWGITALVWVIGLVLSMYLGRYPMPIPVWTRKRGWRIIRYPLHQVFALLISMLIGWAVCGIMTYAGAFPTDPKNVMYKARTDARAEVIRDSGWFYFPHPGQFGSPLFSLSAVVGFTIATVTSILDSIGDYYATAAICRVPPPPAPAVNRGIAVEGLCSLISGTFGVGHATTTFGGNIGAIGMTRVASRNVFVTMSLIYICLGFLAKVSAVFISIPYPVIGGSILISIGVFVGVNLSNLSVIDLSSSRNLSIMGMAIFVGLLVPTWVEKNASAIDTGNSDLNEVISMLLGNPNFFGGFLACFLDNTVPGTKKERGIIAWTNPELQSSTIEFIEGKEVYDLPLPRCVRNWKFMNYVPICPQFRSRAGKAEDIEMTITPKDIK